MNFLLFQLVRPEEQHGFKSLVSVPISTLAAAVLGVVGGSLQASPSYVPGTFTGAMLFSMVALQQVSGILRLTSLYW